MAVPRAVTAVFLSAGVPDRPERGDYVATADPVAIRDAVRAITSVAVSSTQLVFGGHPAITPLVWQVASVAGHADRVVIYQSDWFQDAIPEEALGFENLSWVGRGRDRDASLEIMRREMIGRSRYAAGVFIGGMDGVATEFDMFWEAHPHALAVPVASTGGAALELWRRERVRLPATFQPSRLVTDVSYRAMFDELLGPTLGRPMQ